MTPEKYAAKKEARVSRLEAASEACKNKGNALVESAQDMASVIPLGQPILIGHHSEGRDRRYRGRIENKFRKGYEEIDKAAYYQRRADAAARNTSIFSDDPQAAEKLEAKIDRLEARQELMRSANKALRQALKLGDDSPLLDLGFSEAAIAALKTPDCFGGLGYASYKLTNNGANIRRLKERLRAANAQAARESKSYSIGAFRIVEDTESNRVQLFFAKELLKGGKTPRGEQLPNVKDQLKDNGFHFSWENTCWQRQLTDTAIYHARRIAGSQRARYEKETDTVRSVPENWCLAHRVNGKWERFDDGACAQWYEAIVKVLGQYSSSETDLAVNIGASLQS